MKSLLKTASVAVMMAAAACSQAPQAQVGLTLIPPGVITSKVDLDMRAGIVNQSEKPQTYSLSLMIDGREVKDTVISLEAGESGLVRHMVPTSELIGNHTAKLSVATKRQKAIKEKDFTVLDSGIRSNKLISGAWAGLYHWSEQEGLHWNKAIKSLTNDQWKEVVRSMHKIGMDVIVIQEVFRNEAYVGHHDITVDTYEGKAFYPSKLYPGRMEITAEDPLEAILSEADELGMNVLMGVGMFAWFDFTEQSLIWHKNVARELWDMYGRHDSFYGFYISEEQAGKLYRYETEPERIAMRKKEIVDFFRLFKEYTRSFAPEKPIMLATNTYEIPEGLDTYPAMLENLDILCPFCFARMPEGDITGKEAADILQKLCDDAGSHLWFDLEAFLFNPDGSLYPRPIEEIITDLTMFENFEKILCYQYPGVFSDPEMSIRVGEERCEDLFRQYSDYRNTVLK
jgi:hypothetical protein